VLAEQRQSLILSMVNQRGSLSNMEIRRKLRVSRETVRRDLVQLAERHALRKTHGGALALEGSVPAIAVREVINAGGKRAIGRRAASLVPDGASVMLGSGSTVQAVADALAAREGLTVVTNSLAIAGKFAGRNRNRVYLLGGEIQTANGSTLGRDSTAMLAHYFADFAVVGAGAIAPDGGLMDYTREEAELYDLMLRSARTAVIVADHTKFSRHAPARVGSLAKATHLVTDRRPQAPLASALAALPLEVLVTGEGRQGERLSKPRRARSRR
jgi:DeoR/GlpR family transcriptional regulator of sugar metabolism